MSSKEGSSKKVHLHLVPKNLSSINEIEINKENKDFLEYITDLRKRVRPSSKISLHEILGAIRVAEAHAELIRKLHRSFPLCFDYILNSQPYKEK